MSKNVSSADNQQERLPMQSRSIWRSKTNLSKLPSLSLDYIVGLVDGEGYFSVTARNRKYPTYVTREVRMVFGIEVKESDGDIIARLWKYFQCGNLYLRIDDREKFCNLVIWQVRSNKDILEKIIPFFERHPLQVRSKKRAFNKFVKIGKLVANKEHLTPSGFLQVKQLAKSLHW